MQLDIRHDVATFVKYQWKDWKLFCILVKDVGKPMFLVVDNIYNYFPIICVQ